MPNSENPLQPNPPQTRQQSVWRSVLTRPMVMAAGDLVVGVLAYLLAWSVRRSVPIPLTEALLPQERWAVVGHPWAALTLTQLMLPYLTGLYDDLRLVRRREVVGLATAVCALQLAVLTSIFFFSESVFPRTVILLFGFLNLAGLTGWRIVAKASIPVTPRRTLVVAHDPGSAAELIQDASSSSLPTTEILGVVVAPQSIDTSGVDYAPVLGTWDQLAELVVQHKVDDVIFASSSSWRDDVMDTLSRLQDTYGVGVAIRPSVYDMVIGKLRHVTVQDSPLIEVKRNPNEPIERVIKRLFDMVLSALLLVIVSPLLLLVALAIKVFSPGSVFYFQERIGKGGRVFRLVKFRTMLPDAEKDTGEILAAQNDPRVTPIGNFLRRTRIDEVPQLWNVLKGEMSFVGPRPERPGFVRQYLQTVPGYAERHKVNPGITGLAQVRGQYDSRPENKIRYDLAYIYNYSFLLDLLILLETAKVVIQRRGR